MSNYDHYPEPYEISETGHIVRSSWEEEIDLFLYRSGIEYTYEEERFEYGNGRYYYPDFIVEDRLVIEIKGWAGWKDKRKAEAFMENYGDDYIYMVVGGDDTTDMLCHLHLLWEDRHRLPVVLTNFGLTLSGEGNIGDF